MRAPSKRSSRLEVLDCTGLGCKPEASFLGAIQDDTFVAIDYDNHDFCRF